MTRQNFFVFTGAMGAGKSTVFDLMRSAGYSCVDDPARQVLREQRSFRGQGVPETDSGLFNQLMLSRAIHAFERDSSAETITIFDRGIPDLIAYADLFDVDRAIYERAASRWRYNEHVFFFGGWEEIYTTDDERKMTYEAARQFGQEAARVYREQGYTLVDVPHVPKDERADFVRAKVQAITKRNG
jgi:predicted ATPase